MIGPGWHPRVKPEHGLWRLGNDRVRIGGSVYGIAAEVIDKTGAVWTMLNAADGTRSPDEIAEPVLYKHPTLLSDRERERYDRSLRFYRWIDERPRDSSWDPQLLLKQARVLVVGLGGTGGTAALASAFHGNWCDT